MGCTPTEVAGRRLAARRADGRVVFAYNIQAAFRCAGVYIDTRSAAARNWVGLRAPHGRSLFYEKSDQKRATRFLGRPATRRGYAAAGTLRVVLAASRPSSSLGVGQIPLNCPFSWRRSHQGSHPQLLGFSLCVGLHRAPFMPPRKRAQGFDVALYRRGASRLSAAEVGFAASRTPSCQTPSPMKTRMLPSVLAVQRLEKPPV